MAIAPPVTRVTSPAVTTRKDRRSEMAVLLQHRFDENRRGTAAPSRISHPVAPRLPPVTLPLDECRGLLGGMGDDALPYSAYFSSTQERLGLDTSPDPTWIATLISLRTDMPHFEASAHQIDEYVMARGEQSRGSPQVLRWQQQLMAYGDEAARRIDNSPPQSRTWIDAFPSLRMVHGIGEIQMDSSGRDTIKHLRSDGAQARLACSRHQLRDGRTMQVRNGPVHQLRCSSLHTHFWGIVDLHYAAMTRSAGEQTAGTAQQQYMPSASLVESERWRVKTKINGSTPYQAQFDDINAVERALRQKALREEALREKGRRTGDFQSEQPVELTPSEDFQGVPRRYRFDQLSPIPEGVQVMAMDLQANAEDEAASPNPWSSKKTLGGVGKSVPLDKRDLSQRGLPNPIGHRRNERQRVPEVRVNGQLAGRPLARAGSGTWTWT